MKVLVTAGSTAIPIDKVRVISNIFKGKTGYSIAEYFHSKNEDVSLLTSLKRYSQTPVCNYKTYDELYEEMYKFVQYNKFDLIIHSAAVSDYYVEGVYTKDYNQIAFELERLNNDSKVKSNYPEMYLKLKPTRKIVDDLRFKWGYTGTLIKFKLQVDMSDEELIEIAQKSRIDSEANYIVANCLEWCRERAYIISENSVINVKREYLPKTLYQLVEKN